MRSLLRSTATLALLAVAPALLAAPPAANVYLYKYRDEHGVTVISPSIPPEIARGGYQLVTRTGQVVQDVPPSQAVDPAEAQRVREEAQQSERRDADLRKLYSAPADAERMRNRQVDAITLKIDFAKGQLLQLGNKRKTALEQAAKLERQGHAVPAEVKDNIDRLNRQITEQEAQVAALEADKARLIAEFEPVIERLKVIYPGRPTLEELKAKSAPPAAATGTAPAPKAP